MFVEEGILPRKGVFVLYFVLLCTFYNLGLLQDLVGTGMYSDVLGMN